MKFILVILLLCKPTVFLYNNETQMAQFFKAKSNKSKQLSSKLSIEITQLDHLGAGIGQYQGKVVFVPGALPNETVTVQLTEQKKNFAKGKLLNIDVPSPLRIKPQCPHYSACGGCDMQHMDINSQREFKQNALIDLVNKLGHVANDCQQAQMITDEQWHYRRRARLATLYNPKTQQLALGFRQSSSNAIVPIKACDVLAPELSALITPFAVNLNQLKSKSSLGHLELSLADNGVFALLRITKNLPQSDMRWLSDFAKQHNIYLLVQDNDLQITQLYPEPKAQQITLPYYLLAGNNNQVKCEFTPGNFVQVNGEINQRMVTQALDWLDVQPNERVLDLFCGVGNFSLPLATFAQTVVGVEGVPDMVQKAKQNATLNQLANLEFYHADLSADLTYEKWLGRIDKLLLDPARAGAFESLQKLSTMRPKKVVYVSCNPASLARDSKVLAEQGYQLTRLGLVDMFPQTHHIEAMALFELA